MSAAIPPVTSHPGLSGETRAECEGDLIRVVCAVWPSDGRNAVLTISSAGRGGMSSSFVISQAELIGLRDTITHALSQAGR
jgi:hypothetical protein